MEIFKLFGSILVENDKANKSLDETDKKGMGVAKTFGGMIGTAAKVGGAMVAMAGVAGAAVMGIANKTAAYADEIDKLSERTGINREELQRWKYAAGQSGADISKLEVGMKKLSDAMVDATEGGKKNTAAFEKLGISFEDLKTKSQSAIFEDVMNALAEMPKGAERNALGNDVLGKSYTELLPLLNSGAAGMQELKNRADELGLVMSEDSVKAGVKFGDTMDDLKQSFGAVFNEIGMQLIPVMQQMADWIIEHMPEIRQTVDTVFTVFGEVVGKTLDILTKLYNFVEPSFPIIGAIIKTAFEDITSFVQTGIDIFDNLTSSIKTALRWLGMYKDEKESTTFTGGSGNTHGGGGQAFANGTDFAPGGRSLVGERGPEIVELPRGSKVYTAEETAEMLGGGTVSLDVPIQLIIDSKVLAEVVSRIQLDNTRGKARAVGVSI